MHLSRVASSGLLIDQCFIPETCVALLYWLQFIFLTKTCPYLRAQKALAFGCFEETPLDDSFRVRPLSPSFSALLCLLLPLLSRHTWVTIVRDAGPNGLRAATDATDATHAAYATDAAHATDATDAADAWVANLAGPVWTSLLLQSCNGSEYVLLAPGNSAVRLACLNVFS